MLTAVTWRIACDRTSLRSDFASQRVEARLRGSRHDLVFFRGPPMVASSAGMPRVRVALVACKLGRQRGSRPSRILRMAGSGHVGVGRMGPPGSNQACSPCTCRWPWRSSLPCRAAGLEESAGEGIASRKVISLAAAIIRQMSGSA